MTLPASGAISLNAVAIELGRASGAAINLNESAVRTLFGKPSGAISLADGYGKSNYRVGTGTVDRNGGNPMSMVITSISNGQPYSQISLQLIATDSGQSLGTTVLGNCDAAGNFYLVQSIAGSDPYWFPAPKTNSFWVLQDSTYVVGSNTLVSS